MKPIFKAVILFLLLLCLPATALAASEAVRVQGNAAIGTDGSCALSVTVQLHLDAPATDISFPLPADATQISLNGSFATTFLKGNKLHVALPNLTAGDYTFTVACQLPAVVSRDEAGALVTVPLLSGFGYPIRSMQFSLTLPGEIQSAPGFTSGYHQADIAEAITVEITGNTLNATVHQPLRDHETLVITLPADAEYFPQVSNLVPLIDFWDGAALVCLLLSIVYYLLTLMPRIPRRERRFTPPDGIAAGEVGMYLTGAGIDLTLMVLSWAEDGYLQIQVQGKRKVLLHKRMEMGNERSDFEMRTFQAMFGNRTTIDGTGVHYARLYRKLAVQNPVMKQVLAPRSGIPMVFRLLSCAVGCFSGVKLGLSLAEHPVVRVLLAVLVCLLCGIFCYLIQSGGKSLPLRNKGPLWLGLLCGCGWVALGTLAGAGSNALLMVLFQLICGIAIAFGGRRSEMGNRSLSQIWGLRHYMVRANTFELQQRLQANSNYFYLLAPYALALGVDKRFARRFGKAPLGECGFLITDGPTPATAAQWAALLRQVADTLNARQKSLPYEKLSGRV